MLTINKPAHYGYRSLHDLPTPPTTSRPSPPLIFQERRKPPANPRSSSPPTQPMSAPHRGLPPPAAMTLTQSAGPPPPQLPPPPAGPSVAQGHPPPPPQQGQAHAQFPAAPSWHQVSEESMRAYLAAKTEEEKRRQEEEKTRQATLRLEQRRMEHDILQASLQGGIPPPMVPIVFAGMAGGVLPQAALDWAHQYVFSQSQPSHPPALLPPGQIAASPRRESQAQGYGPYSGSGGVPSTPGSAQGPPSGYMSTYPGSPTRPRGQSISGPWSTRPALPSGPNLPTLNTTFPGRSAGEGGPPTHPGGPSAQQQESQSSSSIYFHHWQPPTGQGGGRGSGTDQPGTPSGESPKKRKATGPQQAPPVPSSGNPFQTAALSNPPQGRRRGHSRQRSDLGPYRVAGRAARQESFGPPGVSFSFASGPGQTREGGGGGGGGGGGEPSQPQRTQSQRSGGPHSVSSLLADRPPSPQMSQYHQPRRTPDVGAQQSGSARRGTPDDMTRGGASQTATHERQSND